MAFFDRLFGKGRHVGAARAAELRGDLARAVEQFAEAGEPLEASRVLLVQADAEIDPRTRLLLCARAASFAPDGTEANKAARLRRAELLLALAGDAAISAVARHEIAGAARDLEAIGEPVKAAEAYARAGDKVGEARALQAAGDVEGLEFLLSTEQHEERISRAREDRSRDIDIMIESGKRREALAALEELLRRAPEDAQIQDRVNGLRSRRVTAPIVTLETSGQRWRVVLGDEIIVGRSEGAIQVASNAVSRQHLRIARDGASVTVCDLQSRNGTQLRGINLAGALPVNDGLELRLGREVTFRVAPSHRLRGSFDIDVGGEHYVAWLGPAWTPVSGLGLVSGPDGWIELVAEGARAFVGDVELVPRATLLAGDSLAISRGAEPILRFVAG